MRFLNLSSGELKTCGVDCCLATVFILFESSGGGGGEEEAQLLFIFEEIIKCSLTSITFLSFFRKGTKKEISNVTLLLYVLPEI
jgi:hypothetical protein